jgi:hypothetical protein
MTGGGADLTDHLRADLPGWSLEPTAVPGQLRLTPPGGAAVGLEIHHQRGRLQTLTTCRIHVVGPTTALLAPARVVLHHTGQLRRTGLQARPRRVPAAGRAEVDTLIRALLADGALARACLALDATRFEVSPRAGRWWATLELMGGSYVRTTLPPTRSYVRLAPDQREALACTLAVLQRVLPGPGAPDPAPRTPPPVAGVGTAATVEGTSATTSASRDDARRSRDHLPRRPV